MASLSSKRERATTKFKDIQGQGNFNILVKRKRGEDINEGVEIVNLPNGNDLIKVRRITGGPDSATPQRQMLGQPGQIPTSTPWRPPTSIINTITAPAPADNEPIPDIPFPTLDPKKKYPVWPPPGTTPEAAPNPVTGTPATPATPALPVNPVTGTPSTPATPATPALPVITDPLKNTNTDPGFTFDCVLFKQYAPYRQHITEAANKQKAATGSLPAQFITCNDEWLATEQSPVPSDGVFDCALYKASSPHVQAQMRLKAEERIEEKIFPEGYLDCITPVFDCLMFSDPIAFEKKKYYERNPNGDYAAWRRTQGVEADHTEWRENQIDMASYAINFYNQYGVYPKGFEACAGDYTMNTSLENKALNVNDFFSGLKVDNLIDPELLLKYEMESSELLSQEGIDATTAEAEWQAVDQQTFLYILELKALKILLAMPTFTLDFSEYIVQEVKDRISELEGILSERPPLDSNFMETPEVKAKIDVLNEAGDKAVAEKQETTNTVFEVLDYVSIGLDIIPFVGPLLGSGFRAASKAFKASLNLGSKLMKEMQNVLKTSNLLSKGLELGASMKAPIQKTFKQIADAVGSLESPTAVFLKDTVALAKVDLFKFDPQLQKLIVDITRGKTGGFGMEYVDDLTKKFNTALETSTSSAFKLKQDKLAFMVKQDLEDAALVAQNKFAASFPDTAGFTKAYIQSLHIDHPDRIKYYKDLADAKFKGGALEILQKDSTSEISNLKKQVADDIYKRAKMDPDDRAVYELFENKIAAMKKKEGDVTLPTDTAMSATLRDALEKAKGKSFFSSVKDKIYGLLNKKEPLTAKDWEDSFESFKEVAQKRELARLEVDKIMAKLPPYSPAAKVDPNVQKLMQNLEDFIFNLSEFNRKMEADMDEVPSYTSAKAALDKMSETERNDILTAIKTREVDGDKLPAYENLPTSLKNILSNGDVFSVGEQIENLALKTQRGLINPKEIALLDSLLKERFPAWTEKEMSLFDSGARRLNNTEFKERNEIIRAELKKYPELTATSRTGIPLYNDEDVAVYKRILTEVIDERGKVGEEITDTIKKLIYALSGGSTNIVGEGENFDQGNTAFNITQNWNDLSKVTAETPEQVTLLADAAWWRRAVYKHYSDYFDIFRAAGKEEPWMNWAKMTRYLMDRDAPPYTTEDMDIPAKYFPNKNELLQFQPPKLDVLEDLSNGRVKGIKNIYLSQTATALQVRGMEVLSEFPEIEQFIQPLVLTATKYLLLPELQMLYTRSQEWWGSQVRAPMSTAYYTEQNNKYKKFQSELVSWQTSLRRKIAGAAFYNSLEFYNPQAMMQSLVNDSKLKAVPLTFRENTTNIQIKVGKYGNK